MYYLIVIFKLCLVKVAYFDELEKCIQNSRWIPRRSPRATSGLCPSNGIGCAFALLKLITKLEF